MAAVRRSDRTNIAGTTVSTKRPININATATRQTLLNIDKESSSLVTFDMTGRQLSKQALGVLSTTLQLNALTLAHLNLNFAYIAYTGAEILSKYLLLPECQLVSLHLRGNSLSNDAFGLLSNALKTNRSLVHMNVSSNDFTFPSVQACIQNIYDTSSFNSVLYALDISHNNITTAEVFTLKELIVELGSYLHLLVDTEDSIKTQFQDNIPSPTRILYSINGRYSYIVRNTATLYSISLNKLARNSDLFHIHLMLKLACPQNCCILQATLTVTTSATAEPALISTIYTTALDDLLIEWKEYTLPVSTSLHTGALYVNISIVYGNRTKCREFATAYVRNLLVSESPILLAPEAIPRLLRPIAAVGNRNILACSTYTAEGSSRLIVSWEMKLSTFITLQSNEKQIIANKSLSYRWELGIVHNDQYIAVKEGIYAPTSSNESGDKEIWQWTIHCVPDITATQGDEFVLSAAVLSDGTQVSNAPYSPAVRNFVILSLQDVGGQLVSPNWSFAHNII